MSFAMIPKALVIQTVLSALLASSWFATSSFAAGLIALISSYIWSMSYLVPIINLFLVSMSPPILYSPISARRTTSSSGRMLCRNRTISFTL